MSRLLPRAVQPWHFSSDHLLCVSQVILDVRILAKPNFKLKPRGLELNTMSHIS